MPTAKRVLIRTGIALVCAYAATVLGARLFYRKILYPIPAYRTSLPNGIGQLRTTTASDGVAVHALAFRAGAGQRTIVHFHGNGETIADNVDLAQDLAALGFGVMLVEYRGYGVSAGTEPSEDGLNRDADAALSLLAADGLGPNQIVLWGTSLGSGVAAEMARRGRGSALILVSPYTSIPSVARRLAPFLPIGLVVGDRFDTLTKAPDIHVPTLVIHGDRDEVIPFDMGRTVSAAVPRATFLVIAGGHHNDLLVLAKERVLEAVQGILRDASP